MSLTDAARTKAEKELARAQADYDERSSTLHAAQAKLAQAKEAVHDQAQAQQSQGKATIADLKVELSDAQSKLDGAKAAAGLTDKVTSPGIVRDMTKPLRETADSAVASAQAEVDSITAQISSLNADLHMQPAQSSPAVAQAQQEVDAANASCAGAKTRITLAEKALAAIDAVSG